MEVQETFEFQKPFEIGSESSKKILALPNLSQGAEWLKEYKFKPNACLSYNKCGYRYSEYHTNIQREYLEWKNSHLKFILKKHKEGWIVYKNNIVFKDYYNYRGTQKYKTITDNLLKELDVLGLLIWYLDDGHYDYARNRVLITCYISKDELDKTKIFFKKFDINISWIFVKKKYYSILLNRLETIKFLNLFKKYKKDIPKCMLYKFGIDLEKSLNQRSSEKLRVKKYNKRYREENKEILKIKKSEYNKTERGKMLNRIRYERFKLARANDLLATL